MILVCELESLNYSQVHKLQNADVLRYNETDESTTNTNKTRSVTNS